MSVIKAKRQESPVQFIDTAMQLLEHTLKYTRKQFQHKDYDVVKRIRDLGITILNNVVMANSIYPKSEKDVEKRYDLFIEAKSSCFALVTLLSVIKNVLENTVTTFGWREWGNLLNSEITLLNKIIASDKNTKF